jgi:hypothetical protein
MINRAGNAGSIYSLPAGLKIFTAKQKGDL